MVRFQRPLIPPPLTPSDMDRVIMLRGVSFATYEALRAADDRSSLRLTFLDGVLEIMSPSARHENIGAFLARLLYAYSEERDIPLAGFGSTTFKDRARERGLEPDECFMLGEEKDRPDLALEVVLTSGGVEKLEIYRGLGVPEVWFWVNGRLYLHRLAGDAYEPCDESALLPGLPLVEIERLVATTPVSQQMQAARAFRISVRRQGDRS